MSKPFPCVFHTLPEPHKGKLKLHQRVFTPSKQHRGSVETMPWVGSQWHKSLMDEGLIYLDYHDALIKAFLDAWKHPIG